MSDVQNQVNTKVSLDTTAAGTRTVVPAGTYLAQVLKPENLVSEVEGGEPVIVGARIPLQAKAKLKETGDGFEYCPAFMLPNTYFKVIDENGVNQRNLANFNALLYVAYVATLVSDDKSLTILNGQGAPMLRKMLSTIEKAVSSKNPININGEPKVLKRSEMVEEINEAYVLIQVTVSDDGQYNNLRAGTAMPVSATIADTFIDSVMQQRQDALAEQHSAEESVDVDSIFN